MSGRALLGLLIAGAVPIHGARTQQCEVDSLRATIAAGDSLALRYAPVYWFSEGERYFPTIPFFTAFDGIDSNAATDTLLGNQQVDFADQDEIALLGSDHRPSWARLDSAYSAQLSAKAERVAIFYRIRRLERAHIRDMWRYLESDEQRWKRFDVDKETLRQLQDGHTEFLVVEYYAFYLKDFGLVGHRYDFEFVYQFVPKDPDLAAKFRILVAAGHTDRIPNNVLVLSGESARRQSGDNARAGILVELGDHSSAPDVPTYGVFTPGLDANWHDHDLWGTRDLQASSGLGSLGPYELWMTFPRNAENSVRVFPPVRNLALKGVTKSSIQTSDSLLKYSLLPVEPFKCLFERLSRQAAAPTADQVRSVDSLLELIRLEGHWAWRFLGFNSSIDSAGHRVALGDSQQTAAVTTMKSWTFDQNQIWNNGSYAQPPTTIFKLHLFRPVLSALADHGGWSRVPNVWLTWRPRSAVLLQTGIEVPALPLPIRLPGYIEARAGVYMRCTTLSPCFDFRRTSLALSLLHTEQYNRPFTWYAHLTWVPERTRVDNDSTASEWIVGGGVSVIPLSLNLPWYFAPLKPLRLRFGVATDLFAAGPHLATAVWEFHVSLLNGIIPPW